MPMFKYPPTGFKISLQNEIFIVFKFKRFICQKNFGATIANQSFDH